MKKKKKLTEVAFCYDFDGTLAGGNMQEYGFMRRLGITPEEFWPMVDSMARENAADNNLCYMRCMLEEAKARRIPFRCEDFMDCGRDIPLFKGVEEWFDRINAYALKKGIVVSHYLISSGLQEIVEGTPIAKKFTQTFASTFMYNGYGEAIWPARVVNYTGKTQYLFRINKGCLDVCDNRTINEPMPENERPIPFDHMVYFGDGDTDVPCMSMIKRLGGYCVSVFQPDMDGAKKKAAKLKKDGRVNLVAPADYSVGSDIDRFIKRVIDKFAADGKLKALS
jgi:hypothetical protein